MLGFFRSFYPEEFNCICVGGEEKKKIKGKRQDKNIAQFSGRALKLTGLF